jgi:uncharacterized membrane protein YhaH (DUF805 family)
MIFAQQKGFGGGPGGAGSGPPEAFWIIFVAMMVVFVVVIIIIQIFFLLTLSRALQRCSPRNRQMEPGMVWLNLIPCFNLVWLFVTVLRLADSLREEFYDRRLRADGDFGRTIGLAYLILNLCGMIPYIGIIFSFAGFVCWIIYWVKIAGYSRQLLEDTEERYNSYDERDDDGRDDDRDRRRYDDDYDDRDRYDR